MRSFVLCIATSLLYLTSITAFHLPSTTRPYRLAKTLPPHPVSRSQVGASRFLKDVDVTLEGMSQDVGGQMARMSDAEALDAFKETAQQAQEAVVTKSAELPPPYYAVAAAVVMVVLIGVQQFTIGNVFDDEEKSAQSNTGAVARRMVMRDRSFFKKK